MQSRLGMSGALTYKIICPQRPPLAWRLSNTLRWSFVMGWLSVLLAKLFSKLTGIVTLTSQLEAMVIKADGTKINYGVLSYRSVTAAGVAFLVDDWDDSSTDITNFNYHASGTNNTAESTSDTALGTESTSVTDRATGTKSQPASNQIRSVGTQSFTGSAALVEHGLLSSATEGAGTLWDRSVFSAVNVANGDSVQWTYTLTVTAGS